jgi:Flp pilus assembly protein TadD
VAYREAIATSPKDAALWNRLGICYQKKGDAKAARAAYKKALGLRQDYAEAWNNLGTLDHARGKYKPAVSAYGKAIQLNPQDAVFYKNLGAAWLARGDVDRALEAWTEAFRLDPTGFEGDAIRVPAAGVTLARQYYLYAKLLAARGETEKALEYLVKAHAAGFNDFGKVEGDRDFATLVVDPRYAALK